MPPKKKAPVKKKDSKKGDSKAVVIKTEMTPLSILQVYYKNPRIGNVDKIAKSLHLNGQYKPIIVNIGTHTGRPNEILAGNHTFMGAGKEVLWQQNGVSYNKPAYEYMLCSFVDVDEERAAAIVLADNRTAEDGTYDQHLLDDLIAGIPEDYRSGIGFDQNEIDAALDRMEADLEDVETPSGFDDGEDLSETLDGLEDYDPVPQKSERERTIENESEERREAARARGADRPADPEEDKDVEEIDVQAELQVLLELKEEELYLGNNAWDVPDLRKDMLLKELPGTVKTWAGDEATPDDGTTWWLYNYGLGGRRGLPIDRTILSFFAQDAKFKGWWDLPAYYTARYMTEGLKYVVVPDYSFYVTEARAHHMQAQFKAQWMGRFFQEAGLKVIPRLQFDYRKNRNPLEVPLLGQPRNAPLFASSMQNMNSPEEEANVASILKEALQELTPKTLILYGGNPAKRLGEAVRGEVDEVIWIENYAAVRRATVFDKKDGAAKLTKKQKDELIEKHGGTPKSKRKKEQDPDEQVED